MVLKIIKMLAALIALGYGIWAVCSYDTGSMEFMPCFYKLAVVGIIEFLALRGWYD